MSIGIERAQSEAIAYVLMIALVVGGAGLVVAIGGPGITDTQTQNELQRAENSMTLFDSRAAMVALGDADSQTVSLGQDTGSVRVVDDTGWMKVTHTNYTDNSSLGTHKEIIFNDSLGRVVYEGDDTRIAYQGGGVWRLQDGGEAQMVSPPEFHYRGATLTLPVIRVAGQGSATGSVDLNVQPIQQARQVYPNETGLTGATNHTGAPYNSTALTQYRNYTNSVRNGTVSVTVKSEFVAGWETYFRERTTGNVTRLGNNRVRLVLETLSGPPGRFQLPLLDSSDHVEANGIAGGHSISTFETDLEFQGKGTNDFGYWDYNSTSGEQWELHVEPDVSGNLKCNDTAPVNVVQYYYDGNPSGNYESWEVRLSPSSSAVDWKCGPNGNAVVSVDLTSTAPSTNMSYDETYVDASNGNPGSGRCDGNKWCFNDQIKGNSMKSNATLGGHGPVPSSGSGTCEINSYSPGASGTDCKMGHIVNHYMMEMGPDMRIHAHNGPGGGKNAVQQSPSKAKLLYDERGGGQYVTFLHITENEIEVDL